MNLPPIILVVDDVATNRETLRELLDAQDYRVMEAADGPTALRLMAETPPDLVLLDVMMPGMDGYEVCCRLRADARLAAVPVIMVTALDDQASRLAGIKAGADDFVTKPFNRAELRARVRTITRLNRYRRLLETQTELRESAERYRVLFESNPVPMWLSDPGTRRFLAVNGAAVRHYGYTHEEFLTMTIQAIYPPEDIPALLKFLENEEADAAKSGESRHRRKDGTLMQVEVISTPLRFGDRAARLVLATDVTEKKLLEAKFLHAQRLESIGMLAAGIAHDLNNMLAPILFAAPLLRGSLTAPRDLRILDTVERSAVRGAGLVKQILGFVHNAAGERRPTQVKHLARDIVSLIGETFPKSIQLRYDIPTDLWPVEGNATQIHQVLLNLCVNARDAMPTGGTLRLVATNCQLDAPAAAAIPDATPGAWLRLEVGDTGTGIPPDVLERIWTPFFTTKGIGKGTGLGLPTVRGIVASHHGFVDLQTEVGRGSTFRVYLPASEGEATPSGSAEPLADAHHHGELILVVDDDAAFREIVSDVLRQQGYRIVSCADGLEAITAFNAHLGQVSLVVTDVDMPRLGGVALAQALVKICPGIRLIAISGASSRSTGDADRPAIQTLAHAILLKPFKPDALLGAVHRVLTGAQKGPFQAEAESSKDLSVPPASERAKTAG
jgi:PAS domain S-box-containing protein